MSDQILSVGFALPNQSIDNYTALTAPSYFDYDALVIDPESITRIAREVVEEGKSYDAFDGRPIINGASSASSISLAEQLQRRVDETRRLLDQGGTVIVFARPNATQAGVVGFEGCDRYHWLPAPEGSAWGAPLIRAAEGKTIRIRDDSHPFADVLREYRKFAAYRAIFDERQPAMRGASHVIAVGGGNAPIGVQLDVLAGQVIFLPMIHLTTPNARSQMAQAVVAAVRRVRGTPTEASAPQWTRSLALPGLEQLEAEAEEAKDAAETAARRLDEVSERVSSLRAYRALLWAEGYQFNGAVRSALEALGFAVTSPAGQPFVVEADGETAYVECESSREKVVEWPYVRLQRRLEEQLLKKGSQPRGLVIVNGLRGEPPEERKQQFTDALQTACENYRYSLVTTETLFAMTQRALGGADDEQLQAMRRRLLRGRGIIATSTALGESVEDEGSGTIF